MARVPSQQIRRVAPRPLNLPKSRVSAAGKGEGIGRGLVNLGRGLEQVADTTGAIAEDQILRDNKRKAKQADIAFSQSMRDILFNSENAFYKQKGENAVNAAPGVQEALQKAYEEVLNSLDKQSVKDMFSAQADDRFQTALTNIDKYTINQREISEDATSEARIKEAADDFANNPVDPKLRAQSLAIINSEVNDLADRRGWSPEQRQHKLEEARSVLFQSGIESLLRQNRSQDARKVFEENKTLIDAPVASMLEQSIRQGSLAAESQKAVDAIIPLIRNGTHSVASARDSLRNTYSNQPELRDAIMTRLDRRLKEDADAKDATLESYISEAHLAMEANEIMLDDWLAQNPTKASLLRTDDGAMKRLRAAQVAIIEGREFAPVTTGELGVLEGLAPQELVKYPLLNNKFLFTPEEYRAAERMIGGARDELEGVSKSSEHHTQAIKVLGENAPRHIDYFSKDISNDNLKAKQVAQNRMREWVSGFTDRGEIPTQDQMRQQAQVIWQQIEEQHNDSFWNWFGDKFDFDALTDEQIQNFEIDDLDDVNPATVEQFRNRLIREDIEPSDENIKTLIEAEIQGDWIRQREVMGLMKDDTKHPFHNAPSSVSKRINQSEGIPNTTILQKQSDSSVSAVTEPGKEDPFSKAVMDLLIRPAEAATEIGTPSAQGEGKRTGTPALQDSIAKITPPEPVVPAAQPLNIEGPLPRQSQPVIKGEKPTSTIQPQGKEDLQSEAKEAQKAIAEEFQRRGQQFIGEVSPNELRIQLNQGGQDAEDEVNINPMIDDRLTNAVAQVESSGDPKAVNKRTGAQGKFQVMPTTAKDPGFGVAPLEDPFDPVESERFFKEYLTAMLNRYDDNLEHALAAYNWGPGKVDDWIREGADFKKLPKETRNYVKKIKELIKDA